MTSKIRVKVDGVPGTTRLDVPKHLTVQEVLDMIMLATGIQGAADGAWMSLNKLVCCVPSSVCSMELARSSMDDEALVL